MLKVFISHNRKDKPFADKLQDFLGSRGADVLLNNNILQVGDSIIEKISATISTSDYIIAVLSKSSVKSKWVQKELSLAITREQEIAKTFVLPVVIEDCEIPSFLKDKFYIDFGDPNTFRESANKLLEKLSIADTQELCEYCKNHLPLFLDRCPHCARSAPAPNVRAARTPVERKTLDIRYEHAINDATARGCREMVNNFESFLTQSKAVISVTMDRLMRLVNENAIYATLDPSFKVRTGSKWELLRRVADGILFPGYGEQIRFATLSLNGIGLSNYGECSLVLRDDLIAHRASVFEESAALFIKHYDIRITNDNPLPPGYRGAWKDREKLCVAKLARKITSDTIPSDFPHLLLHNGATSEDDDFIEVHIWGSLTIRTVDKVIFSSRAVKRRSGKAILRALCSKLERIGIEVDISE